MQIEFLKETPINKTKVKKGTVLNFSDSVAQSFIDSGVAKKAKAKLKV